MHIKFTLIFLVLFIGFSKAQNTTIDSLKKVLLVAEKKKDKQSMLNCYDNIATNYWFQSNFSESLNYYFLSLKTAEELGNKKRIAGSYGNIGITYAIQNNFDEALKYYFLDLKTKEELHDSAGIAICFTWIGNMYVEQKKYTEARKYLLLALNIKEQMKDKSIADVYVSIGSLYYQQGNYQEALSQFFAAAKIKEELNDKWGMAQAYINIGGSYSSMRKTSESKLWLQKSLMISKEINNKSLIQESYSELAILDSVMGNYKEAYKNYKMTILYRDSIYNEEAIKKNTQTQMQYEFDKKQTAESIKVEEERKVNNIRFEQEKKQRWFLYSGMALVVIFAGFMFNRFKVTQKQSRIIALQKTETERQKDIIEEKQKEILDSITYAKRLQQAILPPKEFINKHLADSFIFYKPKDIVAGDFYWAEEIGDYFFIAAADSTGHGVPGAMVSIVCSNALNRSVKEFKLIQTGEILNKTRELVLETFEKSASEVKDGMDISLLCIDSKNKNIFWSGANNPLWFIQDNELKEIKADKQSIGKTEYPKPFTTHQIEYKENTTFYLFTDGFADQFGGAKGKKFKYKQFSDLLVNNINQTQQKQAETINKAFENWKGNLEQVDDVCVIGIKI